jgi:hypothetical protein
MAGEPAIRKVLVRLKDWFDDPAGTGVANYIDRPQNQPFRDEDFPLVNISVRQVNFELFNYASWLHTAQIMFEIMTSSSGLIGIDNEQAIIASRIVARMAARTAAVGTIGEIISDAVPVAIGSARDEYDLADNGESTFAWRFQYVTPLNDFNTIAGVNGLVP